MQGIEKFQKFLNRCVQMTFLTGGLGTAKRGDLGNRFAEAHFRMRREWRILFHKSRRAPEKRKAFNLRISLDS